jgi:hypothetical protein
MTFDARHRVDDDAFCHVTSSRGGTFVTCPYLSKYKNAQVKNVPPR